MNKAISFSRTVFTSAIFKPADIWSSAVVVVCGLALIFAGPVLPL